MPHGMDILLPEALVSHNFKAYTWEPMLLQKPQNTGKKHWNWDLAEVQSAPVLLLLCEALERH